MNTRYLSVLAWLLIGILTSAIILTQNLPAAAQQIPQPVALTSVSPQHIIEGQAVSVTLTGSGFTAETNVQVSGMEPVGKTLVNDTTITIAVPETIEAGTYTVSVSNPDGSTATLPNALTVEALEPTPPPPLTVDRSEPSRITSGQQITLSVLGSNFTNGSTVRVIGFGFLQTTFVHSAALTAALPGTIPPGQYTIEVSDSNGMVATSPTPLIVAAPPAPTTQPPPSPTPAQVAFKPSLVLTNFSAQPGTIAPGQTLQLSFTVTNRGSSAARAINVSLGSNSRFVPAGGQAALTLPDMNPGASHNGQLAISAALDIPQGPVTIPLAITYQDFSGEAYTATAELSVTVSPTAASSQIVIDAYTIDPSPAVPESPVTVRMTLANVGNTPAAQVMLRVNGSQNILIPDGRGDTIPVGDLQPGTRLPVQIPMNLSGAAKSGPQIQEIVITYLQNGEPQEIHGSITVNVANIDRPQPLLLLSQYDTGHEFLQPGTRFNLVVTLQNAGNADSRSTVVTFGTVQSSGGDGSSNGNGQPNGVGTQSNTTPSTTFAPLGTAGSVFLGDIEQGKTATASQEFIVSGSVTSGIYALPVTLQYTMPDGSSKQNTMNISLVVIVPPRLQINPSNPLPETLNAAEPVPFMLELHNAATTNLNLTGITITAQNAEVLEGANSKLETLKADDDTNVNALIMPLEAGPIEVEVVIDYLDDLGQPNTITKTYTAQALMPPPPEEPIDAPPVVQEPQTEVNWFGQIMMALLGLGS